MLKHLGLDGWQAWDYAVARLYKRTETAEGVSNMCDVCGSPNGKEHGAACPIAIAEALMVRELSKCQAGHRKPVVYVAGRFRSADGWKVNENVFAAEKAGREVAALGAMPLVPHSIGAHMAGTEDDTFWLTGTLELMRRCDAVLVLPGYQESQGAMGEIAEAQRIGMPVIMPLNGAPGWEELRSWLKLSMLAQGDGSLMLMAKIAEKRLVDARGNADQTLARLGIELGQREGETLLAAAQRVRETGTHAEVERLRQENERLENVCADHAARLREKFDEIDAIAKALGDHDGQTDEEAARALVANLQEARDRHDKVAAIAEKLRKQVEDQFRALDELRARHEDTKRQNEVAGQELDKRDHEALAFAAKRVVHGAELLRQQLASESTEHKEQQLFLRSLVNAGPDEALDVAIGKVMMQIKQLTSERDSLRTEVTMLREELKTQKDEREEDQKELAELAANLDTQRTEVRKLQAVLALCRNERDLVAKELRADKEAFASDATRVRLALESEVKDLKDRLGAATAELAIITKRYDEALELCDRDGMTPTEQIKELRKELEDIRPEAEQMAGWRQSSLNRQVEIQNLQDALAEEKKQRQDFVAALCAELGVQCGERTAMAAVEQMKAKLQAPRKAIVIPHRLADFEASNLARALPLMQPSEPAPSSEASHITHAGEEEVKKALTRPADSICTCRLAGWCSHCCWYSDRGLDDPNEVGVGLVMQD